MGKERHIAMRLMVIGVAWLYIIGVVCDPAVASLNVGRSGLESLRDLPEATAGPQREYNSVTVAPAGGNVSRALTPRMDRWRTAVIAKNVDELLSFAWPEYRDGLRRKMTDQRSPGWSMMFARSGSVRTFLTNRDLNNTIFEHELVASGKNAITCYARGKVKWPKTYPSLIKLSNRRDVFCLSWTAENGQWYVDYSFAFGE